VIAYLHGFASGPDGTKVQFIKARLAALGTPLLAPELAPDFTHMTITSQLAIVEALLTEIPSVLIGSSLGGYLATLVATRYPERICGLVLLAPAFHFANRWAARVGAEAMARWRADGVMNVMHYARDREEPLAIGLLDDAQGYPAEPDPACPTLVFAGRHDDAVPLEVVEHFVRRRPTTRELVVYDTGHDLIAPLESLTVRTIEFLRARGVMAGVGRA